MGSISVVAGAIVTVDAPSVPVVITDIFLTRTRSFLMHASSAVVYSEMVMYSALVYAADVMLPTSRPADCVRTKALMYSCPACLAIRFDVWEIFSNFKLNSFTVTFQLVTVVSSKLSRNFLLKKLLFHFFNKMEDLLVVGDHDF